MKLTLEEIDTFMRVLEDKMDYKWNTPQELKGYEKKQLEMYQKFRELYEASDELPWEYFPEPEDV